MQYSYFYHLNAVIHIENNLESAMENYNVEHKNLFASGDDRKQLLSY